MSTYSTLIAWPLSLASMRPCRTRATWSCASSPTMPLGQAVFVDEDSLHAFIVDVLERRADVNRFDIAVILKVAKRYWIARTNNKLA